MRGDKARQNKRKNSKEQAGNTVPNLRCLSVT